jgi:alkylhydroperoxidase family enzyme
MATKISQGRWTRVRPLQRDELDPYTESGLVMAELTWGRFRNNLAKTMAYTPRLLQTEVEYCNSFIFDPPTFRGDVQETAFNDRFLKELVISRTSLLNRSWYSITHHSFIGLKLFTDAGRREEGHRKLLHLHEHQSHPDVYTPREMVVLNYTVKVTRDPHSVTDQEFEQLRQVLADGNRGDQRWESLDRETSSRYVCSQISELTWLIGHFCLLNRWFTALQVPDEGPDDEDNFQAAYENMVPEDVRLRNARVLSGQLLTT